VEDRALLLGDAEVAGIGASSTHVLLYFHRGAELDDDRAAQKLTLWPLGN